jgi:hypothetical protein
MKHSSSNPWLLRLGLEDLEVEQELRIIYQTTESSVTLSQPEPPTTPKRIQKQAKTTNTKKRTKKSKTQKQEVRGDTTNSADAGNLPTPRPSLGKPIYIHHSPPKVVSPLDQDVAVQARMLGELIEAKIATEHITNLNQTGGVVIRNSHVIRKATARIHDLGRDALFAVSPFVKGDNFTTQEASLHRPRANGKKSPNGHNVSPLTQIELPSVLSSGNPRLLIGHRSNAQPDWTRPPILPVNLRTWWCRPVYYGEKVCVEWDGESEEVWIGYQLEDGINLDANPWSTTFASGGTASDFHRRGGRTRTRGKTLLQLEPAPADLAELIKRANCAVLFQGTVVKTVLGVSLPPGLQVQACISWVVPEDIFFCRELQEIGAYASLPVPGDKGDVAWWGFADRCRLLATYCRRFTTHRPTSAWAVAPFVSVSQSQGIRSSPLPRPTSLVSSSSVTATSRRKALEAGARSTKSKKQRKSTSIERATTGLPPKPKAFIHNPSDLLALRGESFGEVFSEFTTQNVDGNMHSSDSRLTHIVQWRGHQLDLHVAGIVLADPSRPHITADNRDVGRSENSSSAFSSSSPSVIISELAPSSAKLTQPLGHRFTLRQQDPRTVARVDGFGGWSRSTSPPSFLPSPSTAGRDFVSICAAPPAASIPHSFLPLMSARALLVNSRRHGSPRTTVMGSRINIRDQEGPGGWGRDTRGPCPVLTGEPRTADIYTQSLTRPARTSRPNVSPKDRGSGPGDLLKPSYRTWMFQPHSLQSSSLTLEADKTRPGLKAHTLGSNTTYTTKAGEFLYPVHRARVLSGVWLDPLDTSTYFSRSPTSALSPTPPFGGWVSPPLPPMESSHTIKPWCPLPPTSMFSTSPRMLGAADVKAVMYRRHGETANVAHHRVSYPSGHFESQAEFVAYLANQPRAMGEHSSNRERAKKKPALKLDAFCFLRWLQASHQSNTIVPEKTQILPFSLLSLPSPPSDLKRRHHLGAMTSKSSERGANEPARKRVKTSKKPTRDKDRT